MIRMTASHWERIATRLYFEGFSISTIKRDNSQSVEGACHTVFSEWLRDVEQLREPRTWRTVIQVLHEAELSVIATKLENILIHKQV